MYAIADVAQFEKKQKGGIMLRLIAWPDQTLCLWRLGVKDIVLSEEQESAIRQHCDIEIDHMPGRFKEEPVASEFQIWFNVKKGSITSYEFSNFTVE